MHLHQLLNQPTASPATVTACYQLGLRGDISLAVQAVLHPHAPAAVLQAAENNPNPKVRVAWIQRPERTAEEVKATLERERRGDVLAALVPALADNVALLELLASMRKRPVALAIARLDQCPQSVVHDVLTTLDAALARLSYDDARVATEFMDSHADAVLASAGTLQSLPALQSIACNIAAGPAELEHVVANIERADLKNADWRTRSTLSSLISQVFAHPNTTLELIDRTEAADVTAGLNRRVDEQADLARKNLGARSSRERLMEEAATSSDANAVIASWNEPAHLGMLDELVRASFANPAVTAQHVLSAAAIVFRVIGNRDDDSTAAAIVNRYGDDTLADILGQGGWGTEKLLVSQVARNPQQVLSRAVLARLDRGYLRLDAAIELGVVDSTNIGKVPAAAIDNAYGQPGCPMMTLIESHLSMTLRDDLGAWEMFVNRIGDFPGTLDDLTNIVRAATATRAPAPPT